MSTPQDLPSSSDPEPSVDDDVLRSIAVGLEGVGWVVVEHALPSSVIDALRADLLKLDADGALNRAGVGRGDDWQRNDEVRRDRVHWLDADSDVSRWYLNWTDSLRLGLNQELTLGLFDYECHFAWYPAGAFYAAHVDAFRGDDHRKVSTVLYLNGGWQSADGGELLLHEPIASDAVFDAATPGAITQTVNPTGATLVCFLSEEIPHQVLESMTDRFSIAGWYRVNATR